MNCPSCGIALKGPEKFCPSCGKPINESFTARVGDMVDNAVGPQGMAPVTLRYQRRSTNVSIIFLAVMFVVLLIVFGIAVQYGVPIYVPAIFLGAVGGLLVLSLYSRRRVKNVDLSNPENYYKEQLEKKYGSGGIKQIAGTHQFGNTPVQLQQGESILTFASPVYRLQSSTTGPSGISIEKYTENTIIITEKRILFLTCPLPGQGLVIGGGGQDMLNDMMKRRTIRELSQKKVDELKSGGTSDHFPNDFWIDREDLKEVGYMKTIGPMKFGSGGSLSFRMTSGKKANYNIIEATDVDGMVPVLHAVKKYVIY